MTKQLDIHRLMYHKADNLLTVCESDIKAFDIPLHMGAAIEIVGKRETRRYMVLHVEREAATREMGDIRYWEFRFVNAYGQERRGPSFRVFND